MLYWKALWRELYPKLAPVGTKDQDQMDKDQKAAYPTQSPQPANELPSDVETQRSLRRGLMIAALGGALLPCLYCWYAYRVGSAEEAFLPGLALLLAGVHTFSFFVKRSGRLPFPLLINALVLPLWGLLLWLGIPLLAEAAGREAFATLATLLLGAWGVVLSLWGLGESLAFLARSQIVEVEAIQLVFLPIADHPDLFPYPVLDYRYLGSCRGRFRSAWLRFRVRGITRAMEEGRLTARVRFLPERPRVHRFLGWRIIKG
jgi:hypothetical protein